MLAQRARQLSTDLERERGDRRAGRRGRRVVQPLAAAFRRVPTPLVGSALRVGSRRRTSLEPVAVFERHGSETPLVLFARYRDFGKGRWRMFWWTTRALLALRRRGLLAPDDLTLVEALVAARTLPAPLGELAVVLDGYRDALVPVGRWDVRLDREILAAPAASAELAQAAAQWRYASRAVLEELRVHGVDLPRSSVLDAGCGRGYTAFAMAGEGIGKVCGVDLDVEGEEPREERERLWELLGAGREAAIETGDLARLAFPDAAFDAVCSTSVIEHLVELPAVFAEFRRILRPGGIAHHGIDLWFGPAGGHSLCTLDIPWGHVRLDEDEFRGYVAHQRPHETADAIAFYTAAFQRPRLTLAETADAARAAGFDVLVARHTPLPLRDRHRAWFDGRIFRECRRLHPLVTPADLLSVSAKLILRRR